MRGLGLGLSILWEQGVLGVCLCLACGGAFGVGVEWVGGLEQGLEEWSGVMSV